MKTGIKLTLVCLLLLLGLGLSGTRTESAVDIAAPLSGESQMQMKDIDKDPFNASVSEIQELPAAHAIKGFSDLLQTPELPTGCEITALTTLLRYYGTSADKITMAETYLPKTSLKMITDAGGKTYGPDTETYFIGDPFSESGIVCGAGPIVSAADQYLKDIGSPLRAVDVSGLSFEDLYRRISEDQPVMVWVTICMEDRWDTQGWTTRDGRDVLWSQNDHAAVLVGYSENTITVSDPICARREYEKAQFEKVFSSRGRVCVVLE